MSIVKILFYAFVNTKNIFRSIIGDNLNSNLNENDNSELNKKYQSFLKRHYLDQTVGIYQIQQKR